MHFFFLENFTKSYEGTLWRVGALIQGILEPPLQMFHFQNLRCFKSVLLPHFYRSQRSCGQGYVFTRVCDSVNGGACLRQTPWEQTPPRDQTPPPPEQTPPQEQTPAYDLRAAGTHPTGMHSCSLLQQQSSGKQNLRSIGEIPKNLFDIMYIRLLAGCTTTARPWDYQGV